MFATEKVYWNNVREDVRAVNPVLFHSIEKIEPNKNLSFIKARYPYGTLIIDQGVIHLPTKNGSILPLDNPGISTELRKKLSYSPIPLGLLLNKSSEVFIDINQRPIPLNFLNPGELFGVFEALSLLTGTISTPIWSVSAGARSIFMLPKITESTSHRRLKLKYGVRKEPPKNLAEHWGIFADIANHQPEEKRWYTDVLFFTDEWFNSHSARSIWLNFQNVLFKAGWSQMQFHVATDLIWESLGSVLAYKRLKPRPYIVDSIKHLIAIGLGIFPGFKPANNDETMAPVLQIQQAYIEGYNMKDYCPTLMYPHRLHPHETHVPVYYSIAFPTLLAGSPSHRGTPSMMMDLREIQLIMQVLQKQCSSNQNINSAVLNRVLKIRYSYFHSVKDAYGEIQLSEEIPKVDPDINKTTFSENKIFCTSAPFMSGCISIEVES